MNLSVGSTLSTLFNCHSWLLLGDSNLAFFWTVFCVGDYPADGWTRSSLFYLEIGTRDQLLSLPYSVV